MDTQRPAHAIAARRQLTGSLFLWDWVALFRSEDVGMEVTSETRYTVTCEAHGTLTFCSSIREGKRLVRESYCFCEHCEALSDHNN